MGNATCSGHCGSKNPQKLVNDTVCYCDPSCVEYLDCCLDYADYCRPNEPLSCKGHCNKAAAQPIPGGGYCWCNTGCYAWFSDNNSDGSCCPDYPQQCLQVKMPACLDDGRSQGSALNLFLGHMSVSKMNKKFSV